MSAKKTIQFYADLASSRNHSLIRVENSTTPSQGTLTIHCKTCNNHFTTSAKSYQNAKKSGCSNCKRKLIQGFWTGRSRTQSPEETSTKARIKQHKEETRKRKSFSYVGLTNSQSLKEFLMRDKNPYNEFIIAKIENPVVGKYTEKHHIIPLHAGGPDVGWNLIPLTPEDHIRAHELRAQVYNEQGDLDCIKFKGDSSKDLTERRLQSIKTGDTVRRKEGTGIYAEGVSAKGGRIGGTVKNIAKDLSHKTKMTEKVRNALYQGSTWKHEETGIELVIQPDTVFTLSQLLEKLTIVLPDGKHKDLLTQAVRSTAVSNLSRVIKQERKKAYGWSILN